MKKLLLVLCVSMLCLGVFSPREAEAAPVTTTITPTYSGYNSAYTDYSYGGGSMTYIWTPYSGYSPSLNANVTVNLPANIKVISATLNLYGGFRNTYYDGDFIKNFTGTVFGQTFTPCVWGYTWYSGYSPTYTPTVRAFNVTNYFTNYVGGTQSFTISSPVTSTAYGDWTGETLTVIPSGSSLNISYSYVPSTPLISSPVAGSNNKTNVTLSSSSSVVGGAPITYLWQYSLDNSNFTTIGTTATSINWTIPAEIPLNSSIYVRSKASADGIDSAWSASIRFNKSDDPAVAAKLAAESAEAKVIGMDTKVTALDTKMNQLLNADTVVPTIVDFGYSINKATVTRTSINAFNLIVSDNKSTDLLYRYSVNSGTYTVWGVVAGSTVSIDLGTSIGVKKVIIQVKDEAGNVSSTMTSLFKI